ncbi:MAG TPA: four helix bundle protein [Candidatus Nanoarchaeia archaeon]|nr:four helix bundle protein [Candidatus Nanoarchaeia archaeon]
MKEDNLILEKSYNFLLRTIKLYKYLTEVKREYILSKQALRSGTSIGANVEEAVGGQSYKDFVSKIGIAYKEARETRYWLRLLRDGQFLEKAFADSIIRDCEEICRILSKIQITCNNK